jgi:DNA-binding transcriptional MerR regulator
METELISKKELLDLTGISYGQLYRWKRKNIIPEEWFIKKSSFTGQETFFPKDKILERIGKIKNMKDNLSLNDIADIVSFSPVNLIFSKEELLKRNIVSSTAIDNYISFQNYTKDYFGFDGILYLHILDKILKSGEINIDESKLIIQSLEENLVKFKEKDCEVFFIRKFGIASCFITSYPNEIYFDKDIKFIYHTNLRSCIEELKIILNIKD